MIVEATCNCEIFAGFFGIDANGNQPECGNVLRIEVDEDEIEYEDDLIKLPYSVKCDSCGYSHDSGWTLFEKVE